MGPGVLILVAWADPAQDAVQRSQDSALGIQGKAFRRLCRALRAQATYTACEVPATTRERFRSVRPAVGVLVYEE